MLNFKNKKVVVMGLGLHGGGLAVARYLAKQGARVLVTDLKTKKQLAVSLSKLKGLPIKYVLGQHRLSDFQSADMIVKNPDVPRQSPFIAAAKQKGVAIENEASLFFKLCPAPIIAVTGTRGKSTTTTLIYEIIKKYKKEALIAGNIRTVAMFDIISKVKPAQPVILELSSWQLEDLETYKLSPHIGVFTNIMVDHLNRYDNSMAKYIAAKKPIYKFQQPGDFAIMNYDNAVTRRLAKEVKSQLYWFTAKKLKSGNGTYISAGKIYWRSQKKNEMICPLKQIKLAGEHNLQNVLAAICVAKIYGVPTKIIVEVLQNFSGVPYRQQLIREYKGIKYFNDTTATTPDAVIAALNTLAVSKKHPVVLLTGGKDKNLRYQELAKVIQAKVKALILFNGTATEKLVKELQRLKFNKTMIFVDSMAAAFAQAEYLLEPGDIFLLSPGAASFGLFLNEFDRGDQFNQKVKTLK